MPLYEIEGKRLRTETPLSEAEIDEIGAQIRAQATEAPQEAPQETGKPLGSVGLGDITSGFMMGLKDPITGLAQLPPRGLETLTSVGGNYPNVVSRFFGSEAAKLDALAQEEEQAYQRSRGEEGFDTSRLAGNVLNPANLAVGVRSAQVLKGAPSVLRAAGVGAATSATQPVLDNNGDFASQKATQMGIGAVAGPIGDVAVAGTGRVLNPLASKAEETMRQLGVTLTPGQYLGKQAKAIEEFAQNLPLVGSFISNARERQLFQFNKGVINNALRKVDEKLPEDVVGRDAISHVQEVLGKKYDTVLENVSMSYDKGVAAKLGSVVGKSNIAGASKKQELNDLLNSLVYSQIPVDTSVRGAVSGQAFKNIETNFNRKITQYSKSTDPNDLEIADALQQALKIWRGELSSQNPKYAQQLAKINAAYSDVVVMEAAAGQGSAVNGVFTPKNYQTAVRQRDMSRRKRAFAAGKAKGQQVSDAGVDLLAPETGATTEGRLAMGAVGGYGALTNPWAAAGLAAGTKILYSPAGLKTIEAIATKRPDLVRKIGEALSKRSSREGSLTAAMVMQEYQRQTGEMPFVNTGD